MPTLREKSFIGALWLQGRPLNTLDALVGQPAWASRMPPEAAIAPHVVSTVRNDSHLLSCQAGKTSKPLAFYFQWMPAGYHLYVRSPGARFSHPVMIDHGNYLAVAKAREETPSLLRLRQPNGQDVEITTLPDEVRPLALEHAGMRFGRARRRYAPYEYLSLSDNAPAAWTLKIFERNISAPWLSEHDES